MTSPTRPENTQAEVVLHHLSATETWTLRLGQPGPAGSRTLLLPDGVLVAADRLLGDHPLMLRFSCDTHGRWPDGIIDLAALLFGQAAADALDHEHVGRVPYIPPADPGRTALLRLVELADGLDQRAQLSNADALVAALDAGVAVAGRAQIPVVLRAATRYAAALAYVLRALPAELTADRPAAGACLAELQRLVHQQIGDDIRLTAASSSVAGLDREISFASSSERVLVGDRDGADTSHDVQLLPIDGMRLPPSVAVGDDRPEIFLEPVSGKKSIKWRVSARLRAKGLTPPWVRVSDDAGTPLLHVQAQVTNETIEAPLPDLSDLYPGTVRLELLADPGEEALSYTASRRLAAIRQALRAMHTEPDQPTSADRAERWVESARSWSAIGDQAKALIAYDLAAAAATDDTRRQQCEGAATAVRRSARALDLTTYNAHMSKLHQRPAEPATRPDSMQVTGMTQLQELVDDWVCEELASQLTDRRQHEVDLSGRIGYWKTLGRIGSRAKPQVSQQYLRAGLMLAVEAVRSNLRPHARRICAELATADLAQASDPNSTRLLVQLADQLNLEDASTGA